MHMVLHSNQELELANFNHSFEFFFFFFALLIVRFWNSIGWEEHCYILGFIVFQSVYFLFFVIYGNIFVSGSSKVSNFWSKQCSFQEILYYFLCYRLFGVGRILCQSYYIKGKLIIIERSSTLHYNIYFLSVLMTFNLRLQRPHALGSIWSLCVVL